MELGAEHVAALIGCHKVRSIVAYRTLHGQALRKKAIGMDEIEVGIHLESVEKPLFGRHPNLIETYVGQFALFQLIGIESFHDARYVS
jgi:hypothetical protein